MLKTLTSSSKFENLDWGDCWIWETLPNLHHLSDLYFFLKTSLISLKGYFSCYCKVFYVHSILHFLLFKYSAFFNSNSIQNSKPFCCRSDLQSSSNLLDDRFLSLKSSYLIILINLLSQFDYYKTIA